MRREPRMPALSRASCETTSTTSSPAETTTSALCSPLSKSSSTPRWRLCPSCVGRRMNEQAAHLVDRILPHMRCRQWVLTQPVERARVVAFDADQVIAVFGVFAEELACW